MEQWRSAPVTKGDLRDFQLLFMEAINSVCTASMRAAHAQVTATLIAAGCAHAEATRMADELIEGTTHVTYTAQRLTDH